MKEKLNIGPVLNQIILETTFVFVSDILIKNCIKNSIIFLLFQTMHARDLKYIRYHHINT